MLARRWLVWLRAALGSFVLWMGVTALAMSDNPAAPFGLQIVVDCGFALACVSGCCFVIAACLRFWRGALADIREPGEQCLRYLFAALCLRRVAAIRPARRCIVCLRQRRPSSSPSPSFFSLLWALTSALRFISVWRSIDRRGTEPPTAPQHRPSVTASWKFLTTHHPKPGNAISLQISISKPAPGSGVRASSRPSLGSCSRSFSSPSRWVFS